MVSNWRTNAGLLGHVLFFGAVDGIDFTLAARLRNFPTTFVTNHYGKGSALASFINVPLGTGYSVLATTSPKPKGKDSGFPYGFDVLPDRPERRDV